MSESIIQRNDALPVYFYFSSSQFSLWLGDKYKEITTQPQVSELALCAIKVQIYVEFVL